MATWWSNMLGWFGVARAAPAAAPVTLGVDYAPDQGAQPTYDVAAAMSAMAAFPWVVACIREISSNLGGLPLKITRGRGKEAEVVADHPLADLLDRPQRGVPGQLFRRQLVVDLVLTGNWFAVVVADGRGIPTSVVRLHPERVKVVPDGLGIGAYEYDTGGGVRRYSPDDVLHIRNPSWTSGPAGLYGAGVIEALHQDLTTDRRAQTLSSNLARRGRPEVLISPDGDTALAPEVVNAIREKFERMLDGGTGGVIVINKGIKVETPSWSPRDLEFGSLRGLVRDAVLAATGVPPTQVGLPSANYATAREQSTVFWSNLQATAALVDAEFSRLAQRWDRSLRVAHDFSRVDALQASRSERLARVSTHIMNGMGAAEAYAYEGFDDAPVSETIVSAEPAPAPAAPAKGNDPVGGLRLFVTPETRAYAPPVEEADRATLWRSHLSNTRIPSERAVGRGVASYLRGQAKRLSTRVAGVWTETKATGTDGMVVRAATDDAVDSILASIWDELAERGAARDTVHAPLRDSLLRAFRSTAQTVGLSSLKVDPGYVDEVVNAQLGELMVQVSDTTKARVRELVRQGLSEGWSVEQVQLALMEDPGFGAVRALRVGRTEAGRATSAGNHHAYQALAAEGLSVRKQWLTARDSVVRPEHQELDGQTVSVDAKFKLGTGEEAAYPLDFDKAELCVNCRCTTIPVVED